MKRASLLSTRINHHLARRDAQLPRERAIINSRLYINRMRNRKRKRREKSTRADSRERIQRSRALSRASFKVKFKPTVRFAGFANWRFATTPPRRDADVFDHLPCVSIDHSFSLWTRYREIVRIAKGNSGDRENREREKISGEPAVATHARNYATCI